MRGILTLRLGADERVTLEAAAEQAGVSLGQFVRRAALAVAREGASPREFVAPVVEQRPSEDDVLRRVWGPREQWADLGVTAAEAHSHSNRDPWPHLTGRG